MSWWETTVVIAAGALTLFNVVDKIVSAVKAAQNPVDDLKKRVEDLERKIADSYPRYDKKIAEIEDGNRIVQKAIYELLKHSIDGNNIDGLKKAERDLHEYLFDK